MPNLMKGSAILGVLIFKLQSCKKICASLLNLLHRESVAGSVIQASGTVEFEDGLRTGVLLQDC